MKKVIVLLLLVLFISGCGKNKFFTCTTDISNKQDNYKLSATYKIYNDGSYVTEIKKDEKYSSNDKSIIEYFNEYKNLEYEYLNKTYGGYEYDISSKDNEVKLEATIYLDKVDLKKLRKDNEFLRDYIVSNRLTINGAKKFFESKGAVCNLEN